MRASLVLGLCLFALACTPRVHPVDFSTEPFAITPADYPSVVKRWTRDSQYYSGPEIRVFLSATYHSWEWREAKVALLAKQEGLSSEAVETMLARERADYEQWHEFFLKFYTQPAKLNDLNQGDSQWRLSVSDESGHQLTAGALDIKRLSDGTRYLDATTRRLYPYIDEFAIYYRVRFPRVQADGTPIAPVTGGGRLTLSFVSSLRRVDLQWVASDPNAPPEVAWWRKIF